MIPLVAIGLLLWFLLGLRAAILRRGFRGPLSDEVERVTAGGPGPAGRGVVSEALRRAARALATAPHASNGELDLTLRELKRETERFRRVIRSMVATAPLLGLLGTVSGMIVTFASLTERVLFAQSGGVAGGISVALITTQMGLVIAIPGLLASRWLDRREQRLGTELQRLRQMLHVGPA